MADLVLAEAQIVTPVSCDDLIDALPPGRVAGFLDRHPGRGREFLVTADGQIVSATPGSRRSTLVNDRELASFVNDSSRRRLDLRA